MKNDRFFRFLFQKSVGIVILLILLPPPKTFAHQLFNDGNESNYAVSLNGMATVDIEAETRNENNLSELATGETSILNVEYYFDTDPGLGNGEVLNSSNSPLFDASSVLDISELSEGIHMVFFRAQDSNGTWGVSVSKSFYVYRTLKSDSTTVPVAEIQYALDSTSNFNSIGAIVQNTSVAITSVIDIAKLADPGIHTIYFKAKDEANNSSPIVSKSFYLYQKLKSDSTSVPVTEIQYALNSTSNFNSIGAIVQDTAVAITSVIDLANLSDPGIHTVYFKAIDAANNSSPIISKSFYLYHKLKSDSTSVPVTEIQYALDSISNFNLIGAIVQDTSVTITSKIDLANLAVPGIHTVYFKAKDAANNSSPIVSKSFYLYQKLRSDSTSVPVTEIQYALDSTSNFNLIGAIVQDTSVTITSKIDLANLAVPGIHTVYFKAKDAANNSSPIISKSFYLYQKLRSDSTFVPVADIQFALDSTSNFTSLGEIVQDTLVTITSKIDIAKLADPGIHTIFFKAKDAANNSSPIVSKSFYTYTEDHNPGFFKINRIEYSIDSIAKNGNGIPLTIRESLDVKIRANISLGEIDLGIHTVYFKAKDEYDDWSTVKNAQFNVIDIENETPVASAGTDQFVNEGTLVSLDGSASHDNDNQSIIYFWTAPDGITLSDESIMNPTFIAPEVSTTTNYIFSLVVNDGFADSPAEEVIITVNNTPKYFSPVWTGNGFDLMNINIYSAKIDDVELEAGDEIGIFDGSICVGAGILNGNLSQNNALSIVVSKNVGSGNGYTPGNTISYKLFDMSTNLEIINSPVVYDNTNPAWSTDGKFTIGATAYAALNYISKVNQDFILNIGWNIISSYVTPVDLNLKDIFQSLIDAGTLKKVMDENGKTIENFGAFGGWKNNIGNLNSAKGYKVNMTAASTLSLEGIPVPLPLDIPLATGWNIISYPSASLQDAKALVQSLIDAGKLKKVMDETGKTIENFGAFGGWKNNIGNFMPGKGYKVNVLENCTLTIPASGTKSAFVIPELLASEHFKPVFVGNGTDHMSINLVNLQTSGLQAGDEIGVFDGKLCVGSAMIGAEQLMAGSISIPASANDELNETANGFTPGHPIEVKLYRGSQTYKLDLEKLSGNESFEKNESMFAQVNTNELTFVQITEKSAQFKCYPNPFTQEITIEVQNLKQAEITVEIYNMTGQRIKNLFKGINNGHLVLKWNGTNDSGQQIAPGVYLCKVNGQSKQVIFEGGKGK